MPRMWKVVIAGALAVGLVATGVVVTRPAAAAPTVTVYKTPT